MRCFGAQYRWKFLLVLCILTRPAGSSKYCRTRKNIQRYCAPKHPIRYIYPKLAFLTLCDQAFNPPFLGGKINELTKFCFLNKRFETNLSFFSKLVIVSHCVWSFSSKF